MIERLKRALALGAAVGALVGLASAPAQATTAKPTTTRAAAKASANRPAAAQVSSDDPAYPLTRPNPEAEIGKLPNGLTYGVMRRAGTRKVAIILRVGAGSEDETQNERGVAHFLEHMAFNGSRNFPPGTVMKDFADIGVSIGRDQNAETTFDSTTFSLDISEETSQRLDLAFNWLRDVADGSTIEQAQVDRERGVIMSEYVGSRSALGDLAERTLNFMVPDLLGPKRAPIGLKDIIQTVNADTIRGFYHRWYRPETSIVVAVGDLPREELKQRIIAAFGDWKNDTPAAPKPDLGHVDLKRPTAVFVAAQDKAPPTLQVCRTEDKDRVFQEGVTSRTRDFETALWQTTLDKRLSVLANGANPPFISAEVGRDELYNTAEATCVSATLRDQDWHTAMDAIAGEMRRLAVYGLTDEEYQAGVRALNAQVETEVGQAPTMTGAQLAQSIVSNLTQNGTFSTAEEDQRIGRLALKGLTRDKVNGEFARVWTHASQPEIVLIEPTATPDAAVLATSSLSSPPPLRLTARATKPHGRDYLE